MNVERDSYRIQKEEIVVKSENTLYPGEGVGGDDNVKAALDNIKGRVATLEQEGGGGGGSVDITIDAEPTENSPNAVSSGGVYDAINDKLSEVIVNSLDPGDVAVINDLTTGGTTNVLSAEQGKVLNGGKQARMELFVAASNAPAWQKTGADYVCDGTNDEVQIQAAIDALSNTGGRIRLSAGTFYIDALPNDRREYFTAEITSGHYRVGIMLPADKGNEYIIEGDAFPMKWEFGYGRGTRIQMSDALYNSLADTDDERYALFAPSLYGSTQAASRVSLQMRNIAFQLPWNQKKITCVDTFRIARVSLQYISCHAFRVGFDPNHDHTEYPIPMPVARCIGIRSLGGSNWGTAADYKNTMVKGFYEGYQLAGEHVVGINMMAQQNYIGYSFGNFYYTDISCHTMTFLNCSDEQSACGPIFANCNQYQDVHLIGWNEERFTESMPGKARVQNATIVSDSSHKGHLFRGTITYAIMGASRQSNVALPFWETGHGANFVTRNSTHKNAASWSEISSYKGDLGEIIYDTTNNRLVVCTAVSASGTTWRAIATTSV